MELRYPNTSKEVTDRVTDRLFDHIGILSRYPGLGQLELGLAKLDQGHRRLVVGHFKVIYRVDKDRVVVVDIFDSRRDPGRIAQE
jgi:plasmid stabilization system protein ParE